jgi:hypothetical protein
MKSAFERGSFELEQTIPGLFLLQSAAAGIIVGFFLMVWGMLAISTPYRFLLIIYTPFAMLFCIAVCGVLATAIWIPAKVFALRMRMPARVCAIIILLSLLSVLLYFFQGSPSFENVADWAAGALLIGVPTGTLVGSRVRPWRVFTFGTVAIKKGKRIYEGTSESKLALLATLPLRLVSVCGLALSILILAFAWQQRGNDLLPMLLGCAPSIYFAAGAYLSLRSPRPWILLTLAFVINLPVIVMAAYCFAIPRGGYMDGLPLLMAIVYSSFVLLWAICIAARLYAPLVTTQPVMPIFVGRDEPQNQRHMCLGARFSEWEANFKAST